MLGLDAAGKTSILYSFYVAVFCVCRYKCVLSHRGVCDYIDDGVGMYICTFVYVHLQACRAVVCVCVHDSECLDILPTTYTTQYQIGKFLYNVATTFTTLLFKLAEFHFKISLFVQTEFFLK